MKIRLLSIALLAIAPLLAVAATGTVRAVAATPGKNATHAFSTAVHGKFTGASQGLSGPGTFAGNLRLTHFAAQNNHLMATGTLTGTLKDKDGKTKSISQTITVPVKSLGSGKASSAASFAQPMSSLGIHAAQASCTILTLNLGPLHLNLLGLVIDLNQVNLTITGQTGPGNLLGNLLCGIAGLLNGFSLSNLVQTLLNDIVTLLNQALGI